MESTTQRGIPRRSVVQVYFPERECSLTYYNDQFDMRCGDIVYVEGKLEGLRGRVEEINYTFKIKLSDYKRIIAVADTDVHGEFRVAGMHFVTFDRDTLSRRKASSWYMAPAKEDEEYVSGSDNIAFDLKNLSEMKIDKVIYDRGTKYYIENKVKYLCLDGAEGYALVEGSHPYEVDFLYHDGKIESLTCSCFCSSSCKHEVATMLQLRETLQKIEKHYKEEYEQTGYFAAIDKGALFMFAIDGKEPGKFFL